MDFSKLLDSLSSTLGSTLPSVLGALAILVVGWLLAVIVRAAFRKALSLVKLNERVESGSGSALDLEGGIAKGAYYVVLLLTLIAVFNALKLEQVSSSLQALVDQVVAFAPRLIAAGVLALVAWILATVIKTIAGKALGATKLDDRVSTEAGMEPISETLAKVLHWFIILLFLPAILGALGMEGMLAPVQGMVDRLLAALPGLFAALVIGLVGWFLARILRDLVASLLAAAGADRLGEKAGLRGTLSLSRLLGLVVYVFVFVPALIAALGAAKIEAISVPATNMLSSFLAAIPNVFGAAVILAVAYFVSRFIAGLATSLLAGAGFDELPAKLGLEQAFSKDTPPSALVGKLLVFFVMLFASVEAAGRLGFERVAGLFAMLIEFGGQVLLGVVIIAVGYWLSKVAGEAVRRVGGEGASAVSAVARFAILGIVLAMGLRAMGLADDIVNLAFGLTLGSVAVAAALAFGLGGRDVAGRQLESWLSGLQGKPAGSRRATTTRKKRSAR